MTLEINSWSISTTVRDPAGIKLVAPGTAVRRESVVRNVTDCVVLWHDDGKMEFNTSKHYFIYCLIFLTLIELLHENTYIFMHYHQCKNAVLKFWSRPIQTFLWVLKGLRRFIETVLLNTQNKYLNWWTKVSLQFYFLKISFSVALFDSRYTLVGSILV